MNQETESKIGELLKDEDGREYRIIDGKKIYQIENDTKGMNDIINAVRASGMRPSEYLKSLYR